MSTEPSTTEPRLQDNALKGKIARLPAKLREEVCRRIHDGHSGSKILPWLNAQPEVQTIIAAEFGGVLVSDQNLSVWRGTGYHDWLRRHERIERTRELSRYAAEVSRANGSSIADGAASIASGKLLELLEAVDEATGDAKLDPEALVKITGALGSLRTSEQNDVRLQQNDKRLAQKDEELAMAREKFQRDTCTLFLKWHEDQRAAEVAAGTGTNSDKIEALGQLMFGETWKAAEPAPVGK